MGNRVWQDKIDQATVLTELARTCWARSEYDKARDYLLKALTILEEQFGTTHIPLVRVLHSLGLLAGIRHNFEESEKFYKRALNICDTLLGPTEIATATRINYLAGLYNAQAKYEKAERLLIRSLRIYEEKLGLFNQPVALMLMALAIISKKQGKDTQAQAYREEMKLVHQKLEKGSGDLRMALSKLADFYYAQGRLDDADLVFRHGLILAEEQEFPQHSFVAESLLGLARLYADYEDWETSSSLYKRSIRSWEKIGSCGSVELIASLKESAAVLRRIDKHEEAEKLEERAAAFGH